MKHFIVPVLLLSLTVSLLANVFLIINKKNSSTSEDFIHTDKEVESFCENAMTQLAMNECAVKRLNVSKDQLKSVIKEKMNLIENFNGENSVTLQGLRAELLDALNNSNLRFEEYSKMHCDYVALNYKGGSIVGIVYPTCMKGLVN